MSRSLEDIYGLLAFLQASPYSNRHWWQRAVQQPYEAGSRAGEAWGGCMGCREVWGVWLAPGWRWRVG